MPVFTQKYYPLSLSPYHPACLVLGFTLAALRKTFSLSTQNKIKLKMSDWNYNILMTGKDKEMCLNCIYSFTTTASLHHLYFLTPELCA